MGVCQNGYRTLEDRPCHEWDRIQQQSYHAPRCNPRSTGKTGNVRRGRGPDTIPFPCHVPGHNIAGRTVRDMSRSRRSDPGRKIHRRTHYPWCKLVPVRSWTRVERDRSRRLPCRGGRSVLQMAGGLRPAPDPQNISSAMMGFWHVRRAFLPVPDGSTSRKPSPQCPAPCRAQEERVSNSCG